MKFGIDRVDITPDYRTIMGGYGCRQDENDGVNDPLTFTSLIFEENRKKVFIGAVDLVDLGGHEHSIHMRKKIAKMLGINFSSVMINCSHTHGGIETNLPAYYTREDYMRHFRKNREFIETKIFASAKRAAKKMREGKLFYGEGMTSIPMNRRLLVEGRVQNRPNPGGEADRTLKILKITDSGNRIAAVLVRVSCHPVATSAQHLITADFPGAFREVFEKYFPGSLAIFLQGTGGDARPAQVADGKSWGRVAPSELSGIGECLFKEALKVLTGEMESLDKLGFNSVIKEVFLPVINSKVNTKQLEGMLKSKSEGYRICIKKLLNKKAGEVKTGIPLTIQMISFNKKFSILGIEAEVLCALGGKVEKKISSRFNMVLGYTNGSECYLPDKKEYKRGGYEVDNYILYLLPSPLSPKLEDIVVSTTFEFDKKLRAE